MIALLTDLLVLNATIKAISAISADKAGKGFLVVPSEIIELAPQSGRSAEDAALRLAHIASRLEEISVRFKMSGE